MKTNLSFHFPQSHTIGAYISEEARNFGEASSIKISIDYEYHEKIDVANNIDLYTTKIYVEQPRIYLFGFVMRYLLLVKSNYSGSMSNFITLDEHRNRIQNPVDEFLSDWEQWVLNASTWKVITLVSNSLRV
jgi:hypothetical protein